MTTDQAWPVFQAALDRDVGRSIRPVATGLAIVYGLLVVAHLLVLPPPTAQTMAAAAAVTSITLLLVRWFAGRRPIPERWVHLVALFVLGLALANSLLHMVLTDDIRQTTNVMLVTIGAGFFFLSTRWLIAALGLTLGAWALSILSFPPSDDIVHFGFALGLSTMLSLLVYIVRRRTHLRYQRLRRQDEWNKAELLYHARRLETSIAVGQRITSILDLDGLLSEVAELIRHRYGIHFVGIFLRDEAGHLHLRAGTGETGRALVAADYVIESGARGLVGWVADRHEPARVDDVASDQRYARFDGLPNTRSELALPLRVGDTMLGVLDLQSESEGAFARDDMRFMQLLADQVAIAIYNASLYDRERSARRVAETIYSTGRALTKTLAWSEVHHLILEQLAELVSYDRAAVMVQRENRLLMVAQRGFPLDIQIDAVDVPIADNEADIYREISRTLRPLSIADVRDWPVWQPIEGLPPTRAWLGVPLIRSGHVIGMLSVARLTPTAFTEPEIVLASGLADQAAIAVGNAQLYDELARFNRQLEQMDRAKSDFISIASHELRTPLTIVRGYSQMLLKDEVIQNNQRHHQLVAGIQAGAMRLGEIVNSMLDITKIDNRTLELFVEPVSLTALIQVVADELEANMGDRNLTLTVKEIETMPAIDADPDAMQKVFHHLIANAIKYTPDGGQITIRAGQLRRSGDGWPPAGVEIVVSDTGIGIDSTFHELIFSKFYQTGEVALHSSNKTAFKGGGPGLGLAIARGIVEAHGGKIWVESPGYDEGRLPGSRFHVVLPLRQKTGESGGNVYLRDR